MKFSLATVLFLPALSVAFAPVQQPRVVASSTSLNGAKTFEEDLELTREVIAKFMESQGETSSKPAEKKEEAAAPAEEE
jgi:hypothetical protein